METARQKLSRAFCLVALALAATGLGHRPEVGATQSRATYFPNITLETQDEKKVKFYDDLIKNKMVVINVMYTRCDGKLCDQGINNLVQLQKALGDRLGREVFMYSITLDPEYDRPKVLKEYAKAHKAGWAFLTGKAEDIETLRRKLGFFNSDPKLDADRTQHSGMLRIGNDAFNKWTMTSVLSKPDRILEMIERMKPPTYSNK